VVALRNGYRWVERLAPQPLGAALESETALRPGGVYLVTGGQGWLGFELGALLAAKYGARLALLGRQPLPPREEWPELAARNDKTAWKIGQAERLEESGAEVLLLTADAADRDQMARAFAATEERFGRIDGVLHAAGITDESHYFPITETTVDNLRLHFAPKVGGLAVLEELLAGREIPFCLVFSSIAAILGGLGFVGYTAANLVMDTEVERLNRRSATHWASVDWDGWLIGEIAEAAADAEEGSLLALAMTMDEGLAAIERILACPELGQVAVSTGDLEVRLDRWVRFTALRRPEAAEEAPDAAPRAEPLHGRPNLSNAFEAPRNELERQVAGIWQELLGVAAVGVYDNFFELGGDSLLAVHLSSKLRKAVGVEASAGSLLAAQTVAEQGLLLVQKMAEEVDEEFLKEALAGS
jgi:NAD(P)-dependent dehydrogenase (short-subunit alcohol dehydrogenase family)/acyl carrier protein